MLISSTPAAEPRVKNQTLKSNAIRTYLVCLGVPAIGAALGVDNVEGSAIGASIIVGNVEGPATVAALVLALGSVEGPATGAALAVGTVEGRSIGRSPNVELRCPVSPSGTTITRPTSSSLM